MVRLWPVLLEKVPSKGTQDKRNKNPHSCKPQASLESLFQKSDFINLIGSQVQPAAAPKSLDTSVTWMEMTPTSPEATLLSRSLMGLPHPVRPLALRIDGILVSSWTLGTQDQ